MSISNSTQIFSTHAICADSFYAARVLGCGWASRYLFTFLLLDVRSFCKVERVDRFLLLGLSEIIAFFLLVIAASKADTHSRCPLCTWPLSTRVSPVWCLYFPLLLLFNHCCAILFPTLWIAACQASLSFTVSQSLLRLMSFELVIPSNHLVLCHPLLLPSMFLSIRVFCSESALVSGGQSIGASALALVLPMNIQGWPPLGLTGLISLLPKRLSRVFSNSTVWKYPFFGAQLSLWSNSDIHTWLLEKQ